MSLSTLLRYWFLRPDAIRCIVETKGVLWLGLLFVLSAGFAREYDVVDLSVEPWRLALPLLASTVASFILFCFLYAVLLFGGRHGHSFVRLYPKFLGLFWMTAPLAWLYAFPFERFLSPASATEANIWMLAFVSFARVCIISAAATWLLGIAWHFTLGVVLFYGSLVVAVALRFSPQPILAVMGGVPLDERDLTLNLAIITTTVLDLAVIFVCFWWMGYEVLDVFVVKPTWLPLEWDAESPRRVAPSLWLLALSLMIVGIGLTLWRQPEQRRATEAERLYLLGNQKEAIACLAERSRGDFPPFWDAPPRDKTTNDTIRMALEAIAMDENGWFVEEYAHRLKHLQGWYDGYLERTYPDLDWDRLADWLEKRADGPMMAQRIVSALSDREPKPEDAGWERIDALAKRPIEDH